MHVCPLLTTEASAAPVVAHRLIKKNRKSIDSKSTSNKYYCAVGPRTTTNKQTTSTTMGTNEDITTTPGLPPPPSSSSSSSAPGNGAAAPKLTTATATATTTDDNSDSSDDTDSDDDKTVAMYDDDSDDDKEDNKTVAMMTGSNINVDTKSANSSANSNATDYPSSSSSSIVTRRRKSAEEEESSTTIINTNTYKRNNNNNNNIKQSAITAVTTASDPILLLSSSSEDEGDEDDANEEDDEDDANKEDDPEKAIVVTPPEQHRKRDRNDDDNNNNNNGDDDDDDKKINNSSNNNNNINHDDSSSSSDSDSDDFLLDHHRRHRRRRSRTNYWLLSSSRDSKLLHLEKMNNKDDNDNNDADKALQLLLWDIGFNYEIYSHQFEAIRFVAGFISTFPFLLNLPNNNKTMTKNEKTMLKLDGNGESARLDSLHLAAAITTTDSTNKNNNTNSNEYVLPTRGMLLGDEMGLGKTIEALAGAALRNYMQLMASSSSSSVASASASASASSAQHRHRNSKKLLPTLIISPQDGIQNQWYETLIKSGVEPARIEVIGEKKNASKKRKTMSSSGSDNNNNNNSNNKNNNTAVTAMTTTSPMSSRGQQLQRLQQQQEGGCFILCTRYKVQSEMKMLFDNCITQTGYKSVVGNNHNNRSNKRQQPQWQQVKKKKKPSRSVLFPNVPLQHIGKLRNQYMSEKGKEKNNFRREKESRQDCVARLVTGMNSTTAYQTVIVDEAHFCKNVLAYWGLGLALLGSTSHRTALLTGTPYNNGSSDMAALMTYIDPSHIASSTGWWEKATSGTTKRNIVEAVSDWRKAFMIRRTKAILENKLPPRNRTIRSVEAHPEELWIYINYEAKFLNALKTFNEEMEDGSPFARQKMKEVFEIMMSTMACARMALIHPVLPRGRELTIQFSPSRRRLLKREERPKVCIFCVSDPSRVQEVRDEVRDEDSDSDDEHQELGFNSGGRVRTNIDLDDDDLDDEDDLEATESNKEDKKKGPIIHIGPDLCKVSESDCRHFAHERCLAIYCDDGGTTCPRCDGLTSRIHDNLHGNVYCKEISTTLNHAQNGFTASAKIEEAIKWFKTTVPDDDKAIILSFFKGSLDLIEGILVEDLGIGVARYDGDIDKDARELDLDRFKINDTCQVLLATVQSGGTGLNITEANHICFLDRWFNPCVHDQAESRAHRIGQKKEVNITYLDIELTIDVAMKEINEIKGGNANILLADGSSLGAGVTGVGYRDISGVIGKKMKEIRLMRENLIKNDTNNENIIPKPKKSKTKIEKEDGTPKRVPGEGLFKKSKMKKEKEGGMPKCVPGEGLFKKSSNAKKESKNGMPKRVPGEGSSRKSSNMKKENKGDAPKIITGEIIELSSDEEDDNSDPQRRISLDGITIELSSDEEDDSNDTDLQKARRISLEDPTRADLNIKK